MMSVCLSATAFMSVDLLLCDNVYCMSNTTSQSRHYHLMSLVNIIMHSIS